MYQDQLKKIVSKCASMFDVDVEDIMEEPSYPQVKKARQHAMYLAKKRTRMTFLEIGEYFNAKLGTAYYSYNIVNKRELKKKAKKVKKK